MRWINDIKVSFKILILAVIAAVALLSVGYTGYSMLDQANYRMSKMYNQKLKSPLDSKRLLPKKAREAKKEAQAKKEICKDCCKSYLKHFCFSFPDVISA